MRMLVCHTRTYVSSFFFTAGDDGMTWNRLQEKVAYPTLGERMESKIKVLDPHGRVACTTG